MEDADWINILNKIEDDRCILFLGAGASMGFDEEDGLPTGGELANLLAYER